MGEELQQVLLNYPLENIFAVLAFGMLRALGLTFGLFPLFWAMGLAVTLRMGIAFAVSVPLFVAYGASIAAATSQLSTLELVLLSPKELALGFALGLLASLPIHALQFAGSITDSFRGEQLSGGSWPDGTMVQTFSVFYVLIGLFAFANTGGFWRCLEALYLSFSLWPVDQALPALSRSSAALVLELLSSVLLQAVLIAAPLLAVLVFAEIALIVAAKLAPSYVPYTHVFLFKNLIAIAILPVLIIVLWQNVHDDLLSSPPVLIILERLLQ